MSDMDERIERAARSSRPHLSAEQRAIVDSDVFRFLNYEIDERYRQLSEIRRGIEAALAIKERFQPYVTTRISYEVDDRTSQAQPHEMPKHLIDRIRYYLAEAERCEKEIGDRQRQKLRLINDVDFGGSYADGLREAVFAHLAGLETGSKVEG